MKTIFRNALALSALALCTPAAAWTAWPQVDFSWYARVGNDIAAAQQPYPLARPGLIWSPGHSERRETGEVWVEGRWIRDDYAEQVALHGGGLVVAPYPVGLVLR